MPADALHGVSESLYSAADVAGCHRPILVAVSKLQPATAIAELAIAGQRHFGENYVQEAARKRQELEAGAGPHGLVWHLLGHLQGNKAKEAAAVFDWVQSVDRASVAEALSKHRAGDAAPLNVLLQVNVDGEAGKHGCRPDDVASLAETVAALPRLALRGLMVIPTPHVDLESRRPAFRAAKEAFDRLREGHPGVDTLSMGMSDDYLLALGEGATMVRIGTALFGPRPARN